MCGIVGVMGSPNAAHEAYQALLLMQHRGQDAAGILSFSPQTNSYHLHKNLGLVDKVFNADNLSTLDGELALGHTRYSTIGHSHINDIQPQLVNYPYGLGLAHNGNIINVHELKDDLKHNKNRHIFTNNDGEVLLNILADELSHQSNYGSSGELNFEIDQLEKAIKSVFEVAKGGYAVIGSISKGGIFAFRDPKGLRPLVLGKRKLTEQERSQSVYKNEFSYSFASESNALNFLGYEEIRDVAPGEFIFIDFEGNLHQRNIFKKTPTTCMFEWVYFANPESTIDDMNVYNARLNMGEQLGIKIRDLIDKGIIDPDVIVPVPETSRISSISLSEKCGVPYRELLIKNRYIQRSFILNNQKSRDNAVKLKLSPIAHEIKGKNILLVDDSIVRGTTCRRIIEMVRAAGANKIYFASACPPILNPCYYGIDFPNSEELLAHGKTNAQIEEHLGADKVIYLDIPGLKKSINKESLCTACLDGKYPVDISGAEFFKEGRVKDE